MGIGRLILGLIVLIPDLPSFLVPTLPRGDVYGHEAEIGMGSHGDRGNQGAWS